MDTITTSQIVALVAAFGMAGSIVWFLVSTEKIQRESNNGWNKRHNL